jgi:predicted  nucleic acid-binding Zn-ribbon protein
MMNAADWQATAEWLGFIWLVSNAIVWGLFYRAQAAFVTRAEHAKVVDRVDQIEAQITGLFTNEKADTLTRKLDEVTRQNAELIGKLPGVEKSIERLSTHINMLLENELKEMRK